MNEAPRSQPPALERYRALNERARLEAQSAYSVDLFSARAQATMAALDAAERSGDPAGISKARRAFQTDKERFDKAFGVDEAFRNVQVGPGRSVQEALKAKLAHKEAQRAKFAADPEEAERLEQEIGGLADALQFAPMMTEPKPFIEWLPAWFAQKELERKALEERFLGKSTPSKPAATPDRAATAFADMDKAAELREKRERNELIAEILDNGAFVVNTSLINKKTNGDGFQALVDPRWEGKIAKPDALERAVSSTVRFANQPSSDRGKHELAELGIAEAVFLDLATETRHRKEETTVSASGIMGMLGKTKTEIKDVIDQVPVKDISNLLPNHPSHEPAAVVSYETLSADYQDYTGRGGNFLHVKMILPLRIAHKMLAAGRKDPTLFRDLAKKITIERTGVVTEEMWETGKGNGGDGISTPQGAERLHRQIRPPYEAWKKQTNGIEKMLIQDRTAGGPDANLFRESDVATFTAKEGRTRT